MWGLGFGVWGLRFGVWDSGVMVGGADGRGETTAEALADHSQVDARCPRYKFVNLRGWAKGCRLQGVGCEV